MNTKHTNLHQKELTSAVSRKKFLETADVAAKMWDWPKKYVTRRVESYGKDFCPAAAQCMAIYHLEYWKIMHMHFVLIIEFGKGKSHRNLGLGACYVRMH